MLRCMIAFIGYLLIVVICCNYPTCSDSDFTDRFVFKKRTLFNFTIEPSVFAGNVLQFWTNTGLWYVMQFNRVLFSYLKYIIITYFVSLKYPLILFTTSIPLTQLIVMNSTDICRGSLQKVQGHRAAQGNRAGVNADLTPSTGGPVGHACR